MFGEKLLDDGLRRIIVVLVLSGNCPNASQLCCAEFVTELPLAYEYQGFQIVLEAKNPETMI